jgi:hypothetical protein
MGTRADTHKGTRMAHSWSDADAALAYLRTTSCRIVGDEGVPTDPPEASFLAQIRQVAKQHGWLCYHTWRSTKSEAGFPDLVLAKPGRLIIAEVKSATGKLTQAQQTWLSVLAQTIPRLEIYQWRPRDWEAIKHMLTQP